MNFFGIGARAALRQRLSTMVAVVLVSVSCCICGALMTFVFAPGQAMEARRISRLPILDGAGLEAAAVGEDVLFTGTLVDNAPLLDGSNLVTYIQEAWEVTMPSSNSGSDGQPFGRWELSQTVVPELTLNLDGQLVQLHAASNVRLGGLLHEQIVRGSSPNEASYEGELLPAGSQRYRGLADGDMTTVLGKKAVVGGVIPEHLFAGDRVAFEASQRQQASALLYSGICTMILAPIILIGGVLWVTFRRR